MANFKAFSLFFGFLVSIGFCNPIDTIHIAFEDAIFTDGGQYAEVVIPNTFCSPGLYNRTLETEITSLEGTTILRGVVDSTFQLWGQSDGLNYETHIKIRLPEILARYYSRHTLKRPVMVTADDVSFLVRNAKNWRLVIN